MPSAKPVLVVAFAFASTLAVAQEQPSIEVPMKGLSYSMLSRNGVTVMAAQLHYNVLGYTTVQVWISNGSKSPVRISPQFFDVRTDASPAFVNGASDDFVIDDIQQHVKPKDLSELVNVYETTLYGFANDKSVGYYERRKHAVMSSMSGGGKLRAMAMVSALVLAEKTLKPGESIDGTVFFRLDQHAGRIVAIGAHLAGSVFDFPQTPPEEHVH